MTRRTPSSAPDLPALWAEYKGVCSRCLPERAAGFVRGRHFDRLLVAYAVYGSAVAGALALALTLWPELLHWLPGWRTLPEAVSR
jgi:hypothetical protein